MFPWRNKKNINIFCNQSAYLLKELSKLQQ